MIFASVLLFASALDAKELIPLAELTAQECPSPTFDKQRGYLGDRAIISDDGANIVVQCGNGVVWAWRSGTATFKPLGVIPLFHAARDQGIVPSDMRCPWSARIREQVEIEADCEILDHDATKDIYLLQNAGMPDSFVVAREGVLRESSIFQRFGALVTGQHAKLAVVDGQKRPELLQKLAIQDGDAETIARLPSPNLLFEEGEGRAVSVAYSALYNSIIVSFGGVFRVAEEMTYVRAFDNGGNERWKIAGQLPSRDEASIVGDATKLIVFAHGRYALFAKTSDRTSTTVLELKNGTAMSTIHGWPLAAARDGEVGLIKSESGVLSLVNLIPPAD